jgi:hypothetical protein
MFLHINYISIPSPGGRLIFFSHLQTYFLFTKLQFFTLQYFYIAVHHYQQRLYEPWLQVPMINKLYVF